MKRKRSSHTRRTTNGTGSAHDYVKDLMAKGAVEDEVAAHLKIDKNRLRRRHISALKSGRNAARAAAIEATAVSVQEYHFLDAATSSFASDWHDPVRGNPLYPGGPDGDAKTVLEAFARWKERGGRYITTGLSNRFSQKKLAEFSKIVASYNQRQFSEDAEP
jgi:hypothetical protein